MSIDIPADWPGRNWVEDTPIGHLDTLASDAASGTVPTRWRVASWESTREIASSALPGQVRHKTGLSIGTGKALVKRQQDDFPWKQSDVYGLTGSEAQLLIAPEGHAKIPTGQYRVADVAGDLTTAGVTVDLDERTIDGAEGSAGTAGLLSSVYASQLEDARFDPVWWIAQLAEDMGYGVGLAPGQDGYDPLLDIPFQGSLMPAYPAEIGFSTTQSPLKWGELDGRVALAMNSGTHQFVRYDTSLVLSGVYTVTVDVNDTFQMRWQSESTPGYIELRLVEGIAGNPNTVEVGMSSLGSNNIANAATAGNVTLPVVADRPAGVQVQVEPFLDGTGTAWGSVRFRARRGAGVAWSAWVTHTMTNRPGVYDATFDIHMRPDDAQAGGAGGLIARYQLVEGADPTIDDQVWTNTPSTQQGRIYLEPLLGSNLSPWLDPDLSRWGAIQAIAEAWQGAVITDVYGNIHVLNRNTLVGVGTGPEIAVDIGKKFEDLPWVMNWADQADRLVLKYRPVVTTAYVSGDPTFPVIWEASDIIICRPGVTEVFVELDYLYPTDLRLIPFVRKDNDNNYYHVWDAYRYNNGTGNHIDPNTEIAMRIDRVTSSTWKIYIENRTAQPFHMVDSSGTPWLKLRSGYFYDQRQEQTIERGLSASATRNPLEVDVSNYVQTEADANALADFIWGRVNTRSWRATTVNAVPDYRLDLGDVVEIQHERTGVRSNALITKVKLAGDAGQVTQHLDLVLIPSTWEDFDEAWSGPDASDTWTEFDALWAPYVWDDFDRTPTATTAAEIQEGM